MKKQFFIFFSAVFISFFMIMPVMAENRKADEFDWEAYSYEELLEIQEDLTEVIHEKYREWAIANSNRLIDFDTDDITLYTAQKQTIIPSVTRITDDAPETTRFVWTSSDDSVARVSGNGLVTGVSRGDAEITCTAADDEFVFNTVKVHVILPVKTVAISEPKITLLLSDKPEDAEYVMSVTINPEDAFCQDVTWSSSNEAVVTVDENGQMKAQAPGNAVITAVSSDPFSASSPKRATAAVTVLQAVSSIELDQSEMVMNKKGSASLTATVLPENASQKTVTWESSDPSVVRVTNGKLTALSTGEAEITCSAADGSGKSAKTKITVIQMVTGLTFPGISGTQELLVGESIEITPAFLPQDATDQRVSWSSSDESILSVTSQGVITAESAGKAAIICSALDGSNISASINFSVPSIGFNEKTVTVTDRRGMEIDVPFYGDPQSFEVSPVTGPIFEIVSDWDKEKRGFHLNVIPVKSGSGTVTLKDSNDAKSSRSFTLTVDHSAVYDTVSFPQTKYADVVNDPDKYKGTDISVSGKVIQKTEFFDHDVILRIAAAGNMKEVFWVTYNQSDFELVINEEDQITVYGKNTGVETFTDYTDDPVTFPVIEAERIVTGKK